MTAQAAVRALPIPSRRTVRRMAACLSVSLLTTMVSLSVLAVLTAWFGVAAWMANVVATAVGTVPRTG